MERLSQLGWLAGGQCERSESHCFIYGLLQPGDRSPKDASNRTSNPNSIKEKQGGQKLMSGFSKETKECR